MLQVAREKRKETEHLWNTCENIFLAIEIWYRERHKKCQRITYRYNRTTDSTILKKESTEREKWYTHCDMSLHCMTGRNRLWDVYIYIYVYIWSMKYEESPLNLWARIVILEPAEEHVFKKKCTTDHLKSDMRKKKIWETRTVKLH